MYVDVDVDVDIDVYVVSCTSNMPHDDVGNHSGLCTKLGGAHIYSACILVLWESLEVFTWLFVLN